MRKIVCVIMAGPRSSSFSHASIIHVADADMDATYGASVAVEAITFNNTNNGNRKIQN